MKKRISIGLIVVVVLLAIYAVFFPTKITDQNGKVAPAPVLEQPTMNNKPESVESMPMQEESAEDMRYQQMQEAYQRLAASRNRLKSRLGMINATTWKLELAPAQKSVINKNLALVVILLKNPPLRGAFRDVEGIETELTRLDAAHVKLDEVERLIAEASANDQ